MDALRETFRESVRVVTSRAFQRTVVNIVLLVSGAVSLLGLAGIATALFFQNFVPDEVVTRTVHLQYGSALNPYGLISLAAPAMKSQQEYDVSITLSLPRSPANVDRGNFMINLHLLDAKVDFSLYSQARQYADSRDGFTDDALLYTSRRPALFPYVDPVVSLASRVLFLFYHLLVPGTSSTTMRIPLAERVMFPKGATIPGAAYVEIEAGQSIQIYQAALSLTAQLRGLRWLMFHYRLPTYLAFTFVFWVSEVVFMAVAWFIYTIMTTADEEGAQEAKRIEGPGRDGATKDSDASEGQGDLSDQPETFPTYGRQPPLKYEPKIKEEEEAKPLSEQPIEGAEADDEDEDEEGYEDVDQKHGDSGIGTSYSAEGSGSVRKRPERK